MQIIFMYKMMTGFLMILGIFLAQPADSAAQQGKEILYVGTFSEEGLLVVEFDRAERSFRELQRVPEIDAPNFQAIHPEGGILYSVSSQGLNDDDRYGSVAAYRIDSQTGELSLINIRPAEGQGPCHVSVDPNGRFVYVSNYSSGNISVYPIDEDGSLGKAVDVVQHEGSSIHSRQGAPHMHSVIPSADGRFIYASDLGIDKVKIYSVNPENGKLSPAEVPYVENVPGSGPRHFTIHPNGGYAYSVEELSSTVAAFSINASNGALDQFQRVEMLPEGFDEDNTAADIHISPDGRFLYATNRGHDSLAIYEINQQTGELTFAGHKSTYGGHPRNFAIDLHGEFLFVVNRDDDNLVLFERNPDTGELSYTGSEAAASRAVCVTQYFLD